MSDKEKTEDEIFEEAFKGLQKSIRKSLASKEKQAKLDKEFENLMMPMENPEYKNKETRNNEESY